MIDYVNGFFAPVRRYHIVTVLLANGITALKAMLSLAERIATVSDQCFNKRCCSLE